MRKLWLVIFIASWSVAQGQTAPGFQPYFSAAVVKELAASVKWYQSVFDLKVKAEMNDPKESYRIAILESPNYMVELLELKGSLTKEELLKDRGEGAEAQGHFKIGFKISDTEAWLKHLKNLGIDVPQAWTDAKTGKKNFIVKDPDGNLIQFFEG